MAYHLTAWATVAALAVYIWTLVNVGQARGKFNIPAPASDGPIEFLSVLRVQANTVEQMVVFIPALWMCAFFLGDNWAAAGGAIWAVGRVVYALGYYKDPAKRSWGFFITAFGTLGLLIGTVIGLATH